VIHIINKFAIATGGSEQRAIRLSQILSTNTNVRLWATHKPDSLLCEQARITEINPWRFRFPMFGTFIFMGTYLHIGPWIRLTRPRRRIIVFNTNNPEELTRMATQISPRNGIDGCELVYSDETLQTLIGRPGPVHKSPIDLARFQPVRSTPTSAANFTVGRLSRDYRYKFHEDDPQLFCRLSELGFKTRLLGGNCLAEELAGTDRVEILGEGQVPAPQFLKSLDCFIYRTSSNWFESFGRVVFEAMASGLPVVCGPKGGYARYIEHGVNGFIFRTNDEAIEILSRLRNDPDLRSEIGRNARLTVERMYSEEFEKENIDYYLR
jgi:Glycosyl transferases group 1